MLTAKNREAIDWYLSADPECSGNGGRSWQRVYGTKRIETAMASWSRRLRDVNAQAYLVTRRQELENKRTEQIVYGQAEALRDLLKVQRDAMQIVSQGKAGRRTKYTDPDTGAAHEAVAYADVEGMRNPAEAIKATVEAIRIQGKHPDQQVQGTGVQVSININTEWAGAYNSKVVNAGDHAEPREAEEGPPRVVVIGRK